MKPEEVGLRVISRSFIEKHWHKDFSGVWCSVCDALPITPEDPSSGRFFLASGTIYNFGPKPGVYLKFKGDYPETNIVFGLCPECDKFDK